MICKYVYEDRRSHHAETADSRSGTCSCVERRCETCQRRCETRTRASEDTESAAELTASTASETSVTGQTSGFFAGRTLFYAHNVSSLTGIVEILCCASASVYQQSASHSFTQSRTVGTAERANRETQTQHFIDLWKLVCVASALLIRRSLVRAQVGEPHHTSGAAVSVCTTAASHSRTQFLSVCSNLKTLPNTGGVLFLRQTC